MTVTATEFKTNFGKYLQMASSEDIYVTRNGRIIAKVTNPHTSALESLRGLLRESEDMVGLAQVRGERRHSYGRFGRRQP